MNRFFLTMNLVKDISLTKTIINKINTFNRNFRSKVKNAVTILYIISEK